ncbi:beta-lactamase hydrolase domain-containing protein [Piscinibacter sakaiensis]|uniref:beta-lactamase hydrolase domain-containing protein n=1 Tax=Piscinibacter sakaiensis TaxID=1547922 RepID=UPI003AAC8E6A
MTNQNVTVEGLPARKVTVELFVGPQPMPEQLEALKAAGFNSIINNRPDNEGGADQPSSAELESAARAAGLEYRHLPVPPKDQADDDARQMFEHVNTLTKPIYAFCRTGNRAEALYRKGQQVAG